MEITAPLRIEELQAGWAIKASGQPRFSALLSVGGKTDLGLVRENNEDKFDFLEPDDPGVLARKGRIYAVADGMGGHSAGQIASEVALNTVFRSYYGDASANVEESLRRAVHEANSYLLDIARLVPGRDGMGTTFTGAVAREDDLYVIHVGDSRLYRIRGDRLELLTADHSWVAEQVRLGAMSEADANASPFRNVITRSLGATSELEPDVFRLKLEPGDRFLFCSDGLSGMLQEDEILRWGSAGSSSVAAWNLVELANQYGGKDNITVLILSVHEIRPWAEAGDAGENSVARPRSADPEGRGGGESIEAVLSAEAADSVPTSEPRAGEAAAERRSMTAWMRRRWGRT